MRNCPHHVACMVWGVHNHLLSESKWHWSTVVVFHPISSTHDSPGAGQATRRPQCDPPRSGICRRFHVFMSFTFAIFLPFMSSVSCCCSFYSPNSVATLGFFTVGVKDRCLIEVLSPRDLRRAFRLRRLAESGGPEQVFFETALSLWCRAHFQTW